MGLIEDAQEITNNSLQTLTITGTTVCVFCGHHHCQLNCVRYALPRIVAALEAAERLSMGPCPTYWDAEMVGTVGRFGPDQGTVLKCAHCRQKLHEHLADCPWQALVAGLYG